MAGSAVPSPGTNTSALGSNDACKLVVRGLPGVVMKSRLRSLLREDLARFGGKPAADSAVLVLRSEVVVEKVFARHVAEPHSVQLPDVGDEVELILAPSKPLWLRADGSGCSTRSGRLFESLQLLKISCLFAVPSQAPSALP